MKKHIKYLMFTFVLMIGLIFSVNALTDSDLTISKSNKKVTVSYSDVFDSLSDAKKSVKDFQKYIKNKNGTTTISKIDTIINSIDSEILSDSFEIADLNEVDNKLAELQAEYDAQATEERSCEVVLGSNEEINTEITTYEDESGVIGEYTNPITAAAVALMVELFENREDYSFRTNVTRERRVVDTIIHSFDETHNTQNSATATRLAYILLGYDVSNVVISEGIVTDVTTETQEFESVEDAHSYKEQLEGQGYRVFDTLLAIKSRREETDQTSVDEDFDSITDLNNYLSDLNSNYNNVDINITDNSYDEETNEDVSQDGFESESDAQDYISDLRDNNNLVYNDRITSYDDTVAETESIRKYFADEASANSYLTTLSSNLTSYERLENTSIRKLSAAEIDVNDILDKGEMQLNNENRDYTLTYSVSATVNVDNRTETGIVTITSATVNGESYNFLRPTNFGNNAVVTIQGTINYCKTRGRILCTERVTENFSSEGILNSDNNEALLSNLDFRYNIYNATATNGSLVVNDNLIDVYVLDTDKVAATTKTLYKAEASVYNKRRIESYNLAGDVSNIHDIPVMVVEFTKEHDRTVYNLTGDATRDIYQTFYIINYNARRTIRTMVTTYRQNYTVVETVNVPSYVVEVEGYYNEQDTAVVNVPNTGVKENVKFDLSYILIILLAMTAGVSTKLALKREK